MLLWLKRLYASTSLSALFTDSCPKGQRIFFKAYNEPLESVTRYTYENPLQQSVSVMNSPVASAAGGVISRRENRKNDKETPREARVLRSRGVTVRGL